MWPDSLLDSVLTAKFSGGPWVIGMATFPANGDAARLNAAKSF
jgi:hypothetical protein